MTDTDLPGTDPATAPSAARAAAVWWANQLAAPRFDNGDSGLHGAFGAALGHTAAARNPVTDAQLAAFADELERYIGDRDRVILDVDYGPGPPLAEAATAAGISPARFPWKTVMWVQPDHVTVSAGYGAREILLWSAPGWVRPICGGHRTEHGPDGIVWLDGRCGRPKYHEDECGDWQDDPERCGNCGGTWGQCHSGAWDHAWKPIVPESSK